MKLRDIPTDEVRRMLAATEAAGDPTNDAIPVFRRELSRRDRSVGCFPQPVGSIRADELLTLDELERRLGLGSGALRAARRRGLPVYRFGRRRFVLGADLIAYVKSNQGVTSCNGKQ